MPTPLWFPGLTLREFAALSLADGTLGRLVDVFAAFIIGGLILVPRAVGAGDMRQAVKIWRRSMIPAFALGLVGLLIGLSGTPIFHLLGQSAALSSAAGSLSGILALGYVAALLAIGAAVFLEGTGRPIVVAVCVILANLTNVGLNWVFIGGHLQFHAMGARGSAISTTIVRFLLAIALVACALGARDKKVAPRTGQTLPGPQNLLGISAALVQGIMLILTSSLFIFAGWLGPLKLAVLSSIFTLNAPVMLLALGLADATGIRVASEDGKDGGCADRSRTLALRRSLKVSLAAISLVLSIFVALWCIIPGKLALLLTNDSVMLPYLIPLIPLACCLIVFDGLSFVIVSALRALRDITMPTLIEIGTMAALVPLAFWLTFRLSLGVKGLILAAIASAVSRAILLLWRFMCFTHSSSARVN